MAQDGEDFAVSLPTTSEASAADDQSPETCEVSTAARTGTITLNETGVGTPCIVVSAGDLVTWVNPTPVPIVVQTAGDQFATQDVSAVFSSLEIPAQAQATARVIHAGRIAYTALDRPGVCGTILVLGRGAA
jgi:hypothetical protein